MSVFKKLFQSRIWRNMIHFLRMGAALSGIEQVVGRSRTFLGMGSALVVNRSGKRTKENSHTESVTFAPRNKIAKKNEKLKRARRRIAKQEQQIAELRAELALTRCV